MKKILLMLGMVAAFAVRADYLYWMVDNPADGYEWTSAKFYQDDVALSTMSSDEMQIIGYGTATLNDGYDVATYYIELYNDASPIAKATLSYNDIKNSIFGNNPISPPGSTTFSASAGSFQAVPEPTSGLLFLVGGMLLGLRRKRRV